jgi:hypothetical protein
LSSFSYSQHWDDAKSCITLELIATVSVDARDPFCLFIYSRRRVTSPLPMYII